MRKEAMHKLKKSILVAMGVFILVPYDKNILESACYKSPLSDTIRKRKFHYYFVFYLIYERSFNPLPPMSDQDRISPYNIKIISSRQVMRIKKNIN